METNASQSITRRPQQLRLFPDEEDDAVYFEKSERYRRLDDTGQKIVCGYMSALNGSGHWPSQSKIAEASGLARSTVCEKLRDDPNIMAAVTEIIALTRDDLACRATIAIPELAFIILRQFRPGEGKMPRDTRTLTKVEYDVLCAASAMGGVVIGSGANVGITVGTRVNADGSAEAAVKVTSSDSPTPNGELTAVIKSLVDGQRQAIASNELETPNLVHNEGDTP